MLAARDRVKVEEILKLCHESELMEAIQSGAAQITSSNKASFVSLPDASKSSNKDLQKDQETPAKMDDINANAFRKNA